MILIKGEIQWTDLNLEFLEPEKLFQYWKQKSFSGFSYIQTPKWQGWLLCSDGDVITGIQQMTFNWNLRTDALNNMVCNITQERDGVMTVCKLPRTVVDDLRIAFPHARSQFEATHPLATGKFLDMVHQLKRQAFDGYILITYNTTRHRAQATFREGNIVSIQTKEIVFNLEVASQAAKRFIRHFVQGAQHQAVVVDLYRN